MMFDSPRPFGQPSGTSLASQSVFGQTSNNDNSPFASKSSGSTTAFGSQTRSSISGVTSAGVLGASQSSSPFSSTVAFTASSSPAFRSSSSAFGSPSTYAFGSPSPHLFDATLRAQGNSCSSTNHSSQPAFGCFYVSSSPFGTTNQSVLGARSSPAFGATNASPFGATSISAFSTMSTPGFDLTENAAVSSTANAAGFLNAPVFGSGGAFGAPSTPLLDSSNNAFGAFGAPPFGASSSPAFGGLRTPVIASSSPSFSFGSSPTFAQSTSTRASLFGAQTSPFGIVSPTQSYDNTGFAKFTFGTRCRGSRVAAYKPTTEPDNGAGRQGAGKIISISAMTIYKDKNHEELRWDDYQLREKGALPSAGQSAVGSLWSGSSSAQPNHLTLSQSSASPFPSSTSFNPFATKTSDFATSGVGSKSTIACTSAFVPSSSPNLSWATTSASTPSFISASPLPFISASTTTSSSTPVVGGSCCTPTWCKFTFDPATSLRTTSTFCPSLNIFNTQSSPLFHSTTSAMLQNTTGQSILSTAPSGTGGNFFSTASSLKTSSISPIFSQPSTYSPTSLQPARAHTIGASFYSNSGQTQPGITSSLGGSSYILGESNLGHLTASQSPVVAQSESATQPASVTNLHGTLPAMPQISVNHVGKAPSFQYGISSLPVNMTILCFVLFALGIIVGSSLCHLGREPLWYAEREGERKTLLAVERDMMRVVDRVAPVRKSSLLTARYLSQGKSRLSSRKLYTKARTDGSKVPFFSGAEEIPSAANANAHFIPRENPRALVIRFPYQWPPRASSEKTSVLKDTIPVPENEYFPAASLGKNCDHVAKTNQKPNGVHEDHTMTPSEEYKHGADIEALMSNLQLSDHYYTQPNLQELAAKERGEPGFCSHVQDFIVGRHGYGSIRFLGTTDIRGLNLEQVIQFNNREVIVYMDESKKPAVGEGLNKPAEITLLNVKCIDKKSGHIYTEGPKVEKYKEMLKKKAEDQGAEFVSFDPINGEWKFRVSHF